MCDLTYPDLMLQWLFVGSRTPVVMALPTWTTDFSRTSFSQCAQMSFSFIPISVEKYMVFSLPDLIEMGVFQGAQSPL